MKFLLSGNVNGKIQHELAFIQELRRQGHPVSAIDSRQNLGITIGYNWEHLMADLAAFTRARKFQNYYRFVEQFCRDNEIDCYLWWNDKLVHPMLIDNIRSLGIKTVAIAGDDSAANRTYYDHFVEYFDVFLTTDPDRTGANVQFYNPSCVLPYIKKLDIPKDIDVLFYGSLYPNRQEVLQYLTKNGVDLTVRSSVLSNEVFGAELNELINRAKITLHVQHPDVKIATLRYFEVLGSGNYLCADYYPNEIEPEHSQRYTKEVVLQMIKRGLASDMTEDNRTVWLKKFTVEYRVKQLLELIQ